MKIITMDPGLCVGCRNCEYTCSFIQREDFRNCDSNIKVNVYPEDSLCIPLTCLHCRDAWCMEVCPAAAISRSGESGAVVIDQDQCAGCKICMLACPFGNIHFDPEQQVAKKCDLCGGDPTCVRFCISGALQFEEEETAFQSKRMLFDGQLRAILGRGKRD